MSAFEYASITYIRQQESFVSHKVSSGRNHSVAGLIAITVSLVGRIISVGLPIGVMRLRQPFMRGTIRILTWDGLRGGLSIALALPPSPERDVVIAATYMVVVISVLAQGLTFGRAMRRLTANQPSANAERVA
jgi:monovalent cation:H+ antiporter, CPA1 family